WTILGAAAEVHQSDQRKAIIAALDDHGGPMKVAELAATTGMKRNALDLLLGRMVKQELIRRTRSRQYAHNDCREPENPNAPHERKSAPPASSVPPAKQRNDTPQAADSAEENDGDCLSVRCVGSFTSKADSPHSVAERVKTETNQTDGQIKVQGPE